MTIELNTLLQLLRNLKECHPHSLLASSISDLLDFTKGELVSPSCPLLIIRSSIIIIIIIIHVYRTNVYQ